MERILGSEFDMGVGIRATVFFLPDFEIGYGHNFKKEPAFTRIYFKLNIIRKQELSIRMAAQIQKISIFLTTTYTMALSLK